ncbi:MAG: hypothetical protein ACI85U_003941 [Candidatus Promineifilaceae bacterium]|jgi:hypothetical protein
MGESTMSQILLNKLTKNALLGTNRLSDQDDVGNVKARPRLNHEGVDRVVTQLDKNDPAHELLATAGVLAIHAQIGRSRTEHLITFESNLAPDPDKPDCPADVAALFERFRRQGDVTLQRQMLDTIQAKGWRLPSDSVPDLLKLGSKNNLVRPQIIGVLDTFGRWLAAKNKDWNYALLPVLGWGDLNQMWLDSPQQIRISIMTWLRQTDPAKGLALLEARWPEEPNANLHALLNTLKVGLSKADEPFIEQALDARQMIVRNRARELLSMIPGSRLGKRMESFAHLVFEWHPEKKPFLTVRMPVKMSAAMVRDGFKDQFEKRRVDFVTNRLNHLISCTPLDYWSTVTDCTPHEFVCLVQQTNWPRTLLGGLTAAATRQRRPDWAKAILMEAGLSPKTGLALQVLDPADIGELALKTLKQPLAGSKLIYSHPLYVLLKGWKQPLPEDVALKIGQTLAEYIKFEAKKNTPNASLRGWLSTLIANAPADIRQEFIDLFTFEGDIHSLWTAAIEKGLRLNVAQLEMEKVFSEK